MSKEHIAVVIYTPSSQRGSVLSQLENLQFCMFKNLCEQNEINWLISVMWLCRKTSNTYKLYKIFTTCKILLKSSLYLFYNGIIF